MALQMTRAEYEKKYGVKPVLSTSSIDTTPAPRRMTREEYEAEFNANKPTANLGDLTADEFMASGRKIVESVEQGAQKLKEGDVVGGITQAGLGSAAGAVHGIFAPFTAVLKKAQEINPLKAPEGSPSITGQYYSPQEPSIANWAKTHPNASRNLLDALTVGTAAIGGSSAVLGKTAAEMTVSQATRAVGQQAKTVPSTIRSVSGARSAANVERELFQIENNYAPMRKANEYSKDAGAASRKRIAETNVLEGAVDTDGVIRTKLPGGPIEKYRAQTIDGREATVRENLVRLDEKVNLEQVRKELVLQVNRSGLEGADLITALRGIQKEIAGLKLRADEFGNVPLWKIHDAKISTTRNINYQTPPETATYRKAVARAHKTVVEENSSYPVEAVNKELGKFYDDIERLKNLDGKRVKGGRLGKYTAQITGNVVGGAMGAVGGAPGAALGAMIGGEVATAIKGQTMSAAFRGRKGAQAPSNPILDKAAADAKLPPVKDLRSPDPRVGAPKDIPKTKAILKLEREIADNVAAQKAAIAKKDFTLVAALKEIYEVLVARLKEAIKKAPRGFAKTPFQPSKADKGQPQQSPKQSPSPKHSTLGNMSALDANAPKSDNGAWPTSAPKPSKVENTSTGNAPTERRDVSAQKAGTLDPFDGKQKGLGVLMESEAPSTRGIIPRAKMVDFEGVEKPVPTLYHGTSVKIEGELGTKNGLWLTDDPKAAEHYIGGGWQGAKGSVHTVELPADVKIYDAYVEGDFKNNFSIKQLEEYYGKQGYDGVRVNDFVRFEKANGSLDGQYHSAVALFPSGLKKLRASSPSIPKELDPKKRKN